MIRQSIILLILSLLVACNHRPGRYTESDEALDLYPDYTSTTIPPNIAPLNFRIENQGERFLVEISNHKKGSIKVRSRSGGIHIPMKAWKKLLEEGKGGKLTLQVYRKTREAGWEAFRQASNEISNDEIDPFIAYRKILPANIYWGEMGIYQRSLENFKVTPIMVNTVTDKNCINCHSFNAGNPEQMLFHMRGPYGGTLIRDGDSARLVDTKSEHTRSAVVYPSWHPDGELIAFSVNKINQRFHSRMEDLVYVSDDYSDIVLYDVRKNSITRPAELASDKLENLPSWSADGSKLFYICADKKVDSLPVDARLYNLMSIGFNAESREFGRVDTLISVREFGKSITHPRESPSGEWISFIGLDYGYFSIFNHEADVYLFNTESGKISLPGINSLHTESYPSWSGNGSWLMFVSKRDDGVLSQVWFSHIDENGNAAKPFILPQKDPGFYSAYPYNFNRPEFISARVDLNPRQIFSTVLKGIQSSSFNSEASISISTGATTPATGAGGEHYHFD